jgi:hypothetical protein
MLLPDGNKKKRSQALPDSLAILTHRPHDADFSRPFLAFSGLSPGAYRSGRLPARNRHVVITAQQCANNPAYGRRPPIAQRRITYVGSRSVRFWYNDKKLRRRVEMECSLEEFVDRWAQHIPEHYQHAVRSFGLFAPRSLGQTSAAIFVILGQKQRSRPKPRPWADSIKRDFGRDPLLHLTGERMKWVRRLAPRAV